MEDFDLLKNTRQCLIYETLAVSNGTQGPTLPMWLNFKTNNRETPGGLSDALHKSNRRESRTNTSPGGGLPEPHRGISRQNSSRSSTRSIRSAKSSGSVNHLKKKLDEYALNTKTEEWQKQQDYKDIRQRRKDRRKQLGSKLRVVRRLYVPSAACIFLGVVFLFGSTIRSIGEGTVFWNLRDQFRIIGPVGIVLGVILLLTTVGLENCSMEKLKKEGLDEVKPFIHPDFLVEHVRVNKQASKDSTSSSYDPNCSQLEQDRLLWQDNSNQGVEGDILCSSITSAASVPADDNGRIDLTANWARAMALNFNNDIGAEDENKYQTIIPNIDIVDNPNSSRDSACLHALYNAPYVEMTDADETTSSHSPVSPSTASASPMSSGETALQTSTVTDHGINRTPSKEGMPLPRNSNPLSNETAQLHGI